MSRFYNVGGDLYPNCLICCANKWCVLTLSSCLMWSSSGLSSLSPSFLDGGGRPESFTGGDKQSGDFQDFMVTRYLAISHLLFVDDILIFCNLSPWEMALLNCILSIFIKTIEMVINF